jgi:hypothetical protein
MNLRDRQHLGQALDVLNLHRAECRPLAATTASIKELDATVGHSQRTGGEVPFVLEMEKVAAQLGLGNAIRRPPARVGQLPDRPRVAVVCPLPHACQVQVVAHPLVKVTAKIRRNRQHWAPCEGTKYFDKETWLPPGEIVKLRRSAAVAADLNKALHLTVAFGARR